MLLRFGYLLLFSLTYIHLYGQVEEGSRKTYVTSRTHETMEIDGYLNESAWDAVEWTGDFIGRRPEFNVTPSQLTQFKILYDENYLYVGVRAFDTEPEKIVQRMSRRDGFEGDWVKIHIDSYHDRRTAFTFTACASGVKGDQYVSNDGGNWDDTWDPIWYLKTRIDDKGWLAEFKIPLSQLRFANQTSLTWGLQMTRRLFRNDEFSNWQPANPNFPGWVNLFGEMKGLKGIKPQKQLEIQPYVVGGIESYPAEEENPFRDTGREWTANAGLDAKIGITSDITLDLTVNPDFGQVESDPSAVNLSAFRLFFREQRPFFLEGNSLMSFQTSGGRNNLYYSRRIGGPPPGDAETDDVEYIDTPNQTRILGAAKLTGKNAKGFSWGIQEAFTNQEFADVIDTLGNKRKEKVASYANYLVARTQKDYGDGKTVVGAYASFVNRTGNDSNGLEELHDDAQSGGVDINHNFKDRKYGFVLKAMASRVSGSATAITETQSASERYYQRPDNLHRKLDTTLTSLAGSAATFSFGKRSGNWRWALGSNYRSPGFEVNDIGFLVQTDVINNWVWNKYEVNKPTRYFRRQEYEAFAEQILDFGGVQTNSGVNLEISLQFHNLWRFRLEAWRQNTMISNADLRGGPSMKYPGGLWHEISIRTNQQKKLSFELSNGLYRSEENYTQNIFSSVSMTYRPIDALTVSLVPRVANQRNSLQYIEQFETDDETHYLLGNVNQETYSMTIRANYNITPNLTIELWAQPFITKGEYSRFKFTNETNSNDFHERFSEIGTDRLGYFYDGDGDEDPYYVIDDNEGFTFDDPDFNLVEFKSNLVTRWEYIPGSTLFLVWSNNGSYSDQTEKNDFSDLSNHLGGLEGTNTFLIKYTYRFIL